jgi:hypothetical protein
MESSFGTIKRRTTEMFESVQKSVPERPNISMPSMPAMPAMPSMPSISMPSMPAVSMPAMPAMPSLPSLNRAQPVKGTWEAIHDIRLPRSSHSLDVVSGTAYIFGGEQNPRKPVDAVMHAVKLPYSSAPADYYKIEPKAAISEPSTEELTKEKELSDVPLEPVPEEDAGTFLGDKGKGKASSSSLVDIPSARVGHATAVIGARIFMFGGRGGPEMEPIEESGRVWVFDTRSHLWSHLDPAPAAPGVSEPRFPAARSYHCATSTDRPRDFGHRGAPNRTWKEWAQGDSANVGIPQAPIVGNVAAQATDEESDGYGTFFIHGGCVADGSRTSDIWAFDVRSRVWSELPEAPAPGRGGSAICVSKSRLYRFGGFSGEELGGQLDYLDLEVEMFNDGASRGEVSVTARGPWQTITPAPAPAPAPASEEAESLTHPHPQTVEWPGPRSVAGFEAITVGGGREVLVLVMGERSPSAEGHTSAGTFWDDVWIYRAPAARLSVSSVTDTLKGLLGGKRKDSTASTTHVGEGVWTKVETRPFDEDYEGDDEYDGDVTPRARGWFAMSKLGDVEESGLVLWGGLREDNKRLADGWIFRLD